MMKKVVLSALAASAALLPVTAHALENWSPHLPGVTEGLAAGALPPPGIYFVNSTLVAPFSLYDKNGNKTSVDADVFVDVPILLWNPGIKVLGADYAVGIAQPLTYVSASGGGLNKSDYGLFSTILMPAQLSWKLPYDFHVLAGLSVYLPTGTSQKSVISYPNGTYAGVPNSINYWSFEPTLGISWLRDGWNVSVSFNFDFNLKNEDSGYTSGNVLVTDFSVSKTFDKWTLGVSGYAVNQFTDDKSDSAAIQAAINASDGNRQTKYAIGPMVGYNFGPVMVSAYYNFGFGAENTLSGDSFWTRVTVPF